MELKMDADNSEYLAQLQAEKESLDASYSNATRLIDEEIERIQSGGGKKGDELIDVLKEKNIKKCEKILIPVKEYPKFNFVGKLLGPKGSSLKRLQEETQTKMSILGKGSMKDKRKEEELRKEGGKYSHLNQELHVLIEVFAPPAECHSRLAHAFFEIKKYMNPSQSDDIYQHQLEEMMYNNPEAAPPMGGPGAGPPRGRGGPAPMGRGAPGRGAPRGAPGRGAPAGGGRGAGALPPPPPIPGALRGSARGASRGAAPPGRGGPGRGAPRGVAAPRSLMGQMGRQSMPPATDYQDESYGYEEAYPEPSYQESQTLLDQSERGAQYFDYGHQAAPAADDYHDDSYGGGYSEPAYSRPTRGGMGGKPAMGRKDDMWTNGASGGSAGFGKSSVTRGRGDSRAHPYTRGGMQRY